MYYFIEPMLESDIAEVQKIERCSFSTLWSANTYRRELRNPASSRYIVVRASHTLPPPIPRASEAATQRSTWLGMLFAGFFSTSEINPEYPIVGYGGLWLTVDDAHITTIAVTPSYRGQGLGELLLNGLIDHAQDLHAALLTLEVRVSNVVAQNLYLKYGFHIAGRRPRYYTDNAEDALIMSTDALHSREYQSRLSTLRRQLFARLRTQAEITSALPGQVQPIEPPVISSPIEVPCKTSGL